MSAPSFVHHAALPSFLRRGRIAAYLAVVLSGQVIYSAFEAFKGSLMLPLQESLGITQTQFGQLMTCIGLAMFLYVPAGWVNNRFRVRSIILAGLGWRLATYLVLFLLTPPFGLMITIAISWAVVDAVMWPAVVNGACILSADAERKGKGMAMGLLEAVRRLTEFALNGMVIIVLFFVPEAAVTVMRCFAIGYSLLLVPMMVAVARFVPDTRIASEPDISHDLAALRGLLRVLRLPRVWLSGLAAMTVYWCDINLMYVSAPYLKEVFGVSTGVAAAFGAFNTGLVAIIAGVVSGVVADYLFKSSTRMMAVALGFVTAACALVLLLPISGAGFWPIVGLLVLVALATFLGKSVILAPIGELELPEEIDGSAMAVGSFVAYASILWGYNLNGRLLDSYAADPAAGYRIIFIITAVVAAVGCLAAVALDRANRQADREAQALQTVADSQAAQGESGADQPAPAGGRPLQGVKS